MNQGELCDYGIGAYSLLYLKKRTGLSRDQEGVEVGGCRVWNWQEESEWDKPGT